MKFIEIKQGEKGKFINRYDLVYETGKKKRKVYEIISRKQNICSIEEIKNEEPAAVVIVAYDEQGRIMLNREFRMSVCEWIFNFPAGLIDKGESIQETAVRELKEETGLNLTEITNIIGKSYSAIGFADESTVTVVGKASGDFSPSTSDEEEITPGWYTKEEVRELLRTEPFAARTQAWCYVWSTNDCR